MNNKFNHSNSEEENGWGKYVTPPKYGDRNESRSYSTPVTSICLRVRTEFPRLIEEDPSLSKELNSLLHEHMTICPDCTSYFAELRRVVTLLESLIPLELPMDFAPLVMQRIATQNAGASRFGAAHPLSAASSLGSGGVAGTASPVKTTGSLRESADVKGMRSRQAVRQHVAHAGQSAGASQLSVRRLIAFAMVTAVTVFFLSVDWGRQMLGANVVAAGDFLRQIGSALVHIPVIQPITQVILAALSEAGNLVQEAYASSGSAGAIGAAFDVAVVGAGYYLLATRRQRNEIRRY